MTEETGVFFHDQHDFKSSVRELMGKLSDMKPRDHVLDEYGDEKAGKKLRKFVEDNFSGSVKLPPGEQLIPVFN